MHITGKVYDLTASNFNKIIDELEYHKKENKMLKIEIFCLNKLLSKKDKKPKGGFDNLYYLEFDYDGAICQVYVTDTGFGILELGVIEGDFTFENDVHLCRELTVEDYALKYSDRLISITKVL